MSCIYIIYIYIYSYIYIYLDIYKDKYKILSPQLAAGLKFDSEFFCSFREIGDKQYIFIDTVDTDYIYLYLFLYGIL